MPLIGWFSILKFKHMKNVFKSKVFEILLKRQTKGLIGMLSLKGKLPTFVSLLVRGIRPLVGHSNRNHASTIWHFGLVLVSLFKHGKAPMVVKYLKACQICLMQAVAGSPDFNTTEFGVRVSRSRRSGLPRVIPYRHRQRILANHAFTVRLWMTLFGFYRIVEFIGKPKLSTIVNPGKPIGPHCARMHAFMPVFWTAYFGAFPEARRPVGAWKDIPSKVIVVGRSIGDIVISHTQTITWAWASAREILGSYRLEDFKKSFPFGKPRGVSGYYTLPEIGKVFKISSAGALSGLPSTSFAAIAWSAHSLFKSEIWKHYKAFADEQGSQSLPSQLEKVANWFEKSSLFHFDSFLTKKWWLTGEAIRPLIGNLRRLHFIPEAAGKVRVIAIADCWTQWILKPLHDWIFAVLSCIPQDGTFDQDAPLKLLDKWIERKHQVTGAPKYSASYDLSAATDRLPILLQKFVLCSVFGATFANLWASLMVTLPFEYTIKTKHTHKVRDQKTGKIKLNKVNTAQKGSVHYAVGQPMGMLSSWGMLALTHHAIVQYCAWRVNGCSNAIWFSGYALLGDDIRIAEERVATAYLAFMSSLGVDISIPKSLVSYRGVGEFAKRLTHPVMGDVSPLSWKEVIAAWNNLSCVLDLVKKRNMTVTQLLQFLGYGHRVVSWAKRPFTKQSSRVRNLLLSAIAPLSVWGRRWPEFLGSVSMLRITRFQVTMATALAIRQKVCDFFLELVKSTLPNIKSMARILGESVPEAPVHSEWASYPFQRLTRDKIPIKSKDGKGPKFKLVANVKTVWVELGSSPMLLILHEIYHNEFAGALQAYRDLVQRHIVMEKWKIGIDPTKSLFRFFDYFQATMFRHPDATLADKWDIKTEQLMFSRIFTRTIKVYLKFWRLPWKMRVSPRKARGDGVLAAKDSTTPKPSVKDTENTDE